MGNLELAPQIVFIVRNQDNRYLSKKHLWRSGNNANEIYRAKERDVALNELLEVNAKDTFARLEIVECELNTQRQPLVEVLAEDLPEPDDLFNAEATSEKISDDHNNPANAVAGDTPHLALVSNNSTEQDT